jgi:hypothetical protein
MKCNAIPLARLAASCAAALLMVGCASPTTHRPLYGWEGYQPEVYEHLKTHGNTDAGQQVAKLEVAQKSMAQRGEALPPGFRAHMGMLYAKTGQTDKSAAAIAAEKAHFPEASVFMDFLLRSVQEKAQP